MQKDIEDIQNNISSMCDCIKCDYDAVKLLFGWIIH